MIIQCEQCRTKFRLDDEKVSDRGVKVRCAKCRHVFTVRKEPGETAAPAVAVEPSTAVLGAVEEAIQIDATPSAAEPEVAFDFGAAPVEAPAAVDTAFDLGQTDATGGSGFDFGDVSFSTEAPAAAAVDFGEMTMVMPPKQKPEPAADPGFDFGTAAVQAAEPAVDAGFDFGEAFGVSPAADVTAQKMEFDFGDHQPVSSTAAGDIDLGGFDFGEATAVAPSAGIDNTDFSAFSEATAPMAAGGDSGFSFDDAVPQSQEASAGSFDFSGMDFGASAPAAAPAAAVDSFSMGELDFSGDTSAVAVDAATAASAGGLFAPVEESVARQQEAVMPEISFEAPPAPEEAAPLSITSRRRQSSTVSIVVGIIAVLVVGVLGYMAFTMFGKEEAPVEDGKITVQNVKAYFVPKAAAGELLVITGEALNSHKKARAALQVKGMVFGANNQALANKTAYAGNPLSQDQLATMTAEKIESAMNNQFGDSLANLEVQPGKTIPFTIVIINPPKDGKDFGVEPVGSTVAASK